MDDLLDSISEILAHNSEFDLDLLKEILYIHRPQHIRDSKDLSHDVRKWIESIAGTSFQTGKLSSPRSSSLVQTQVYQARLDIIFKGFTPFAYYQMFIAWIIRFLKNLSRRQANQKSQLVGMDKVSFKLSEQKLNQSSCEFHFSVAGCGDIVFRVTGPPPLSR